MFSFSHSEQVLTRVCKRSHESSINPAPLICRFVLNLDLREVSERVTRSDSLIHFLAAVSLCPRLFLSVSVSLHRGSPEHQTYVIVGAFRFDDVRPGLAGVHSHFLAESELCHLGHLSPQPLSPSRASDS